MFIVYFNHVISYMVRFATFLNKYFYRESLFYNFITFGWSYGKLSKFNKPYYYYSMFPLQQTPRHQIFFRHNVNWNKKNLKPLCNSNM